MSLERFQNDLSQCTALLGQCRGLVAGAGAGDRDRALFDANMDVARSLLAQLDQFQFPYEDDLEAQESAAAKLRHGLAKARELYERLVQAREHAEHTTSNEGAAEDNALAGANDESEHNSGVSKGQIGTTQYLIQHEPVTAEAIEMQNYDALMYEQDITQISQSITDINTIFHDLNTMVQDQSLQLQSIENNIWSTWDNIKNGSIQLNKAETWQRRFYKCNKLVVMVVVVVLLIVFLVLL